MVLGRRLKVQLEDHRLGIEPDVDVVAIGEDVTLVAVDLPVAGEEPRLVADDGAAQRRLEAVLDVVVARNGELLVFGAPLFALGNVEEVPVELVGARLDGRAGHARDHAAVLRGEAGLHPGLGQRRHRQEDARRSAAPGEAGVDAVDEARVLLPLAAIDRRLDARLQPRLRGVDHAGQHLDRRLHVARDEAQVARHLALDRGAGRGLELADEGSLGGHGDGLRLHAAELELDPLALSATEHDLDLRRAQAFERGADGVVAADEQAEAESAVVVAGGRRASLRSGEIDGHAWQWIALGVEDAALEGAGLWSVGVQRDGATTKENDDSDPEHPARCVHETLLGPSQSRRSKAASNAKSSEID